MATGYCRLLYVSDHVQGDPRDQAIQFGRLLLRCLPRIESVDVQALLPGGHELRIGGLTHGISGLRRQYDHTTLRLAWNQARLRAALTLLGETDTVRLAEALPLLDEAWLVTLEIGNAYVAGHAAATDIQGLDQRVAELHRHGRSLRPPLGAVEIGDTAMGEEVPVPMADDLAALITDLTGNVFSRLSKPDGHRALASYLADTVIGRHLQGAIRQPWHLLGIQGHPASLDRLSVVLHDLYAVVDTVATGDADLARIGRSARSGTRELSLRRAAETCRRFAHRRRQARRDDVQRVCRASGLRATVLRELGEAPPDGTVTLAISVELDSVLEWPGAVSELRDALSPGRLLGETYVFIPLRAGRSLPSLAMKLITDIWPATDLSEWAPQLPEPHPSHLADAFDRAQLALQAISGVHHLPTDQQQHELVRAAATSAISDFENAREELLEYPSDLLTNELLRVIDALAIQVQAEIDHTHSGPSVAEQVAVGALQSGGSEVLTTIIGARYLALEWDISPPAAVDILQALS